MELIAPQQLEALAEWALCLQRRSCGYEFLSAFAVEPKMNRRQVYAMLTKRSTERGRDNYYAMSDWLDFLIDTHDANRLVKEGYREYLEKRFGEEEEYSVLVQEWYRSVKKAIDAGSAIDYFGELYEENFKGKGKADALGQFFTPMHVCETIGNIVKPDFSDREEIIVYDPCCGSGRLLLGYIPRVRESIVRGERYHFFFAGDIDAVSVKMCALNLMVHGVTGLVVQQDALMMSKPQMGYLVNPTDFPIRSGVPSLIPLTQDVCAELVDWKEGDVTHDNFGRWQANRKYIWKRIHTKKTQNENSI